MPVTLLGVTVNVLGALLEGSVAEVQARSNAHVAATVARERRRLAALPSASDFNSKHPRGARGSGQGGKFVRKGQSGTAVREVQRRLGVAQTGRFAFDTEAAVRNWQRSHGLQVDGVVGAQTAQSLLGNRNARMIKPGALSSADARALGVSVSRGRGTTSRHPRARVVAPLRVGGGYVI